MKKIVLISILSIFINAQIVTVIDNGVERKIYLPEPKSKVHARMIGKKSPNSPGIIIAFKKKVDIDKFAKKYNLKLKRKVINKYYIFANMSTLPDVKLIAKIAKENNTTIKTIRPNWGFSNKPR